MWPFGPGASEGDGGGHYFRQPRAAHTGCGARAGAGGTAPLSGAQNVTVELRPISTRRETLLRGVAACCLRAGLGFVVAASTWGKIRVASGVSASEWSALHLPLPGLFGPAHAALQLTAAAFVLAGFLTRACGAFFAADMLGEILVAKVPDGIGFEGWGVEWQILWTGCALLAGGGGFFSVDEALKRMRRLRSTRRGPARRRV